MNWRFRCLGCDAEYRPDQVVWQCPACAGELAIDGLPDRASSDPDTGAGLWRYQNVLPVAAPDSRTILGEGDSPLVHFEMDGYTAYLKLDSQLPTGSFKDRGAALLSQYLRGIEVRRIIVDSSGNAAASMSAYAAATGLDCTVYVPVSASPGKLAQARAYGATVVPIDGSRDDVAYAAQTAAESDPESSYASHNWHAVFVEGVKTWALEVNDQLGGCNPDFAFVPTGGGSSLVGAWRGFGATGSTMPRLVAVQPSACAPVVHAWQQGDQIRKMDAEPTIAEGTKIAMPSRPIQIQRALEESNGLAFAVDEPTLRESSRKLWLRGIYAEPTAVLGVAAWKAAITEGVITEDHTVVIHITGHGLKSTPVIEEILAEIA